MSTAEIHAARGTKHTCGNDECGKRFYDLNRSPLDCPYCGVTLVEDVMPRHQFEMEPGKKARGKFYKLTAQPAEESEEAASSSETESDNDDTADEDTDAPNILIEDDDADATTDDVIEKPQSDDEA
jgi:hypothetical protein